MNSWRKIGLVIPPLGYAWAKTHAQNPMAFHKSGSIHRVFFAPRDEKGRACAAWADIDIKHPERGMLEHSRSPLLGIGRPGAFDDCGVMPHSLVESEGTLYMFYTGWSLAVVVPFTFFIGLARSTDGGQTFHRISEAPVLGRTTSDPFLTAAPWVLVENGLWRMWYVSATHWSLEEGDQAKHYYRIKYAESHDGMDWRPVCTVVDFEGDEHALARPVVRKTATGYDMWFCSRGGAEGYRARHATSTDGLRWNRTPEPAGPEVTPEAFDSDMICYPFVFEFNGQEFMLYNGNAYGRDGIGLAIRD